MNRETQIDAKVHKGKRLEFLNICESSTDSRYDFTRKILKPFIIAEL